MSQSVTNCIRCKKPIEYGEEREHKHYHQLCFELMKIKNDILDLQCCQRAIELVRKMK